MTCLKSIMKVNMTETETWRQRRVGKRLIGRAGQELEDPESGGSPERDQ